MGSAPCPGCGFATDAVDPATVADRLRELVPALAARVAGAPADAVRRRPDPATWSALEYGCHVRDVLLVQRERVLLARRVDVPEPPTMGRDERADHDGYADQDPADVARQLVDAAALLARVLDRLAPGDWDRTMRYTFPEVAVRPISWVAVHTLHEVVHHASDAEASLGGRTGRDGLQSGRRPADEPA